MTDIILITIPVFIYWIFGSIMFLKSKAFGDGDIYIKFNCIMWPIALFVILLLMPLALYKGEIK